MAVVLFWVCFAPCEAARAGATLAACEFVGDRENLPAVGGGDFRMARPTRARFAGSVNTIAEGSLAASGGPDFPGVPIPRRGFELTPKCECSDDGQPDPYSTGGMLRERFATRGTLPVAGAGGSSPNRNRVHQNLPTCPDSGQRGVPASFEWTVGLSTPVLSDIFIWLCPDVRKCQEEDDALGQGMTVPIIDYVDEFGPQGPPTVRVIHHRGDIWSATRLGPSECACEDRTVDLLQLPSLFRVPSGPPPWLPPVDPTGSPDIPNSLQFIGRDCLVVVARTYQAFAAQDFLTVQLELPASTRARVRASSDSAAACYVGAYPPGLRD